MAQGGLLGNGCKVGISLSSPQSWTRVLQLTDVVFPTFVADDVNIDTHSETNKLHRSMSGMIAVGNPSFETLSDWDPSTNSVGQTLLVANKNTTTYWFRFEVPVNSAKTSFRGVEFSATVKSIVPGTPIDGRQTTRYELNFNGEDVGWDTTAGASEIS